MKIENVIWVSLLVLFPVTGLRAQWLEQTVYLGGLRGPACAACAGGDVYVGGDSGSVLVIDGAANVQVSNISVGSGVSTMRCNPTGNKIY